MKTLFKFLGLSILFLVLGACSNKKVEENGNLTTKAVKVSFFRAIHVAGDFILNIASGDNTQSVQITASSNIVPLISTTVSDQILRVRVKKGYTLVTKQPIVIKIALKSLRALSAEGNTQATAAGINAKAFELFTSGIANITLSGQANEVLARISGAGTIDASNLKANDVSVNISGSGNVSVFASNRLDAKISGSGDVVYAGNPRSISQRSTGSGRIHSQA